MRIMLFLIFILFIIGCEKDEVISEAFVLDNPEGPTPFYITPPIGFGSFDLPNDNKLYTEGIELGRMLFYDPILSRNYNTSCSSCHKQKNAFADPKQYSEGTHGDLTSKNSMSLSNLAWQYSFFWDGRVTSLEAQALLPVINSDEMDMTWPEVIERLENHTTYPTLFKHVFGTEKIDSLFVVKAIAQFEYTLISASSKYDEGVYAGTYDPSNLDSLEYAGYQVFGIEGDQNALHKGHCSHCHNLNFGMSSEFKFENNGLDFEADQDSGLASISGKASDMGKFKTPSLRNLAFTAPYMHDGRFKTLRQVIDFYSSDVKNSPSVSGGIPYAGSGAGFTEDEKKALTAFLLTMTDSSFVTNPDYSDPFQSH